MTLFGVCKTTVTCSSVSCFLQKLLVDQSTANKMFKTLLTDLGLKWHFGKDGLCYIEGSWEAMVNGYEIFTAVQKARDHPKIYQDMWLLYEWSIGQVRVGSSSCDNKSDECTDQCLVGNPQTPAATVVRKTCHDSGTSTINRDSSVDTDHVYASRNDDVKVDLQSDVKEVGQIGKEHHEHFSSLRLSNLLFTKLCTMPYKS